MGESDATKGCNNLWLVSITGHLIKQSQSMKPSTSSYRRCHNHSLSSCWGTSTTVTSARKVAHQTAGSPWRPLECTEDNFLSRAIDSPTRSDAILGLFFTKTSELIADISIGGCLCCSELSVVAFVFLRDGLAKTKIRMLKFRKVDFHLFTDLSEESPGNLFSRTREQSRFGRLLRKFIAQGLAKLTCRKSRK